MRKIRTLIIEDSALTRSVLERIMNADPNIEVVGTAIDPIIASKKIKSLKPDVITLDIIMPRMDGLTFLRKLMKINPLPVIIISGNSPRASVNAILALDLGAIEIIEKPNISTPESLREVSERINLAVRAAFESKVHSAIKSHNDPIIPEDSINSEILNKGSKTSSLVGKAKLYAFGASTGGPETLKSILYKLNPGCQPIIIAQHMPPVFTKSYADRMNDECDLKIVEASDGERLERGKVIIIPGDYHGVVSKDMNGYFVSLNQNEKVNRHRPSVDVLFTSIAKVAGKYATGILLTGMGNDGAKGLLNMQEKGSDTIAQNGDSCIVNGMPKRAIDIGAAKSILSPMEIVEWINKNIDETYG